MLNCVYPDFLRLPFLVQAPGEEERDNTLCPIRTGHTATGKGRTLVLRIAPLTPANQKGLGPFIDKDYNQKGHGPI